LSGVIGDTAFNAVRGAIVYVIGSGRRTLTDSTGTFFLDVKPGSYMVEVTRTGFARKLLSVKIAEDSGRHVTVWLIPSTRGADRRETDVVRALHGRMLMRRATALFHSREELNRFRLEWLKELVVRDAGIPIADACEALVDGLWRRPVYSLTLDELESVEVYPPGSLPSLDGSMVRSRQPRSIDPRGTQPVRSGPTCPAVFVWTRR
jgi:hypothetical protein